MKVLYDYQCFEQKFGGISRYFTEIIKNAPSELDAFLSIKSSQNEYILQFVENIKKSHESSLFLVNKLIEKKRYFENKRYSYDTILNGNYDIFHPTYYDNYFLTAIKEKPFVLTIHDMTHEMYPELLSFDKNVTSNKLNLAKRASHIIAVSNKTKTDIVDVLNISKDKITVIYHGSKLAGKCDLNIDLPNSYLLYVGARDLYKNFSFFIRSMVPILKEFDGLSIVCAGKQFNEDETCLFAELGISNKVCVYTANDAELAYLYKNALCFVYPSYYEGFGIPILEAFEANCPAVIANSSCFPEIAGDAALYFEPKSVNGLRNAIRLLIEQPEVRENLIKKGHEQYKAYSWGKASQETYNVYCGLLGK